MEELFNGKKPSIEADLCGRILIVDDDPIAAGMLGVLLSTAGHEAIETSSGEEALALLATLNPAQLPDVIFLDIEMGMGLDGYETCCRMHAHDALQGIPVIFLSGHDGLDDRLRAYQAGGSDFIGKPFVPAEVLHKARLAIRHKRRLGVAEEDKRTSVDLTMTVLTNLGESGVTLKFSRGALSCSTLRALAALTIKSMSSFGLNCHIQLRTPTETLTQTPQGPASPLEESVIEKSQSMGRVFSFGNRLIVNYESVSLMVTNMPIADEPLCGRIRDEAAVIAEAAEQALGNINLRTETMVRAEELRKLAEASREAVEELRKSYRDLQVDSRLQLERMTNTIEGMYVNLGLSNHQEFTISDTVRSSVEGVLTLFEGSSKLDLNFASIVESLTKAGNYKLIQEEEAPLNVELW